MNAHDMRSLMMIVEGRQNDNPDVSYELAGKTKKATAAGEFTQVAASVTGNTSGQFTKLAKKFEEVDTLTKQLTVVQADIKQITKDTMADFFDASDAVYTRYIDTVALAMTMSKDQAATSSETSDLNVNAFLEDLMALVGSDLKPAVEKLLTQNTIVKTKLRPAQQGRVSVKMPSPVKEGALNENDMMAKIVRYASIFAGKVTAFLGRYDAKLANIAAKYNLA